MTITETAQREMDRVAAGLRNMNRKPDAFLFRDGWTDWTYDMPDIYGVPVFHSMSVADCDRDSFGGEECFFIPIWREEDESMQAKEKRLFLEGYENHQYEDSRINR